MRLTQALLGIAIAFSAVAVTRSNTRTCPVFQRSSIRNIVAAGQGAQVPRKFDKSFAGTIGVGLRIRMDLSNDNGTVHGQYFYERVGTPISLDGKIFPKGDFELSELNDDGKPTGHFTGTALPRSGGAKTQLLLSGTWSSADGKKSLPFSISEEVIDLAPGLDIVSRSIKEDSKKPKYEVDVNYPQISGSGESGFGAFNREVEALARKVVADFKKSVAGSNRSTSDDHISMSYDVRLGTPDLISVSFGISEFSTGMAHPSGYSITINYDFKSNRKLRLTDLFLPGKPYLQFVSRYSIGKLKARQGAADQPDPEHLALGAGPKLENYKSWNLTSTGLEITFDAYQVAPYAAGPQMVFIPYSELKPLITPDGPLAKLVH